MEHPLERPCREPEGDGVRLDRRAVLRPSRGARAEEPSVRAGVAAVAVDDAPDRSQRLEQRPTGARVRPRWPGGPGPSVGRWSRRRTGSTRPPRRSAGRAWPAPAPRPGPRRSSRPRSAARPGVGSSSSSHGSVARMFASARASSPATGRPALREPVELAGRTHAAAPGSGARAPASTRPPDRPARRASAPRRGRRRRRAARRTTARPPRCPCATRGYAAGHGRRRALSPCAHADPLPRWRDDRHRLAVPARHRAGQGPHRLRDVPGQPERIDPQPDPVRVRPGRARRRAPDPCPPRPLRPDPAPGQGRLPRPDPRDRRHDRARDARPPRLGQAPRGVRQARGALGEAPPRRGRGRRPHARPTSTRPRSTWPRQGKRRRRPDVAAMRRGRRSHRGRRGHRACRDDHRSRARTRRPAQRLAARSRGRPARPAAAPRGRPRRPALHGQGRRAVARPVQGRSHYDEEVEVAPGIHATFVDAGHILGSAIIRLRVQDQDGGEERVIVCSGDLGRPGTPILRDPTTHDRRRLRPRRVDLRRPRARAGGRGDPHPRRDRPDGRRRRRRPARPVVRDRPDAGGRLGARSADRARRDPAPAALPRLADGVEGVRHLPPPPRLLRRGDGQAPARGRHAARLPEPDRHQRREGVAGDRARAAAVHDRRLERDADRRPGRRPPAQPHRRPERDDPVRRLPGRGHARLAPPGRRHRGQDRRADARASAAGPARSAASRRMPTRASCSTGSATSPPASAPATPAIRGGSSSSTATRRPRSRSSRRSGSSASRPTSRTGTSGSRSTRRSG